MLLKFKDSETPVEMDSFDDCLDVIFKRFPYADWQRNSEAEAESPDWNILDDDNIVVGHIWESSE